MNHYNKNKHKSKKTDKNGTDFVGARTAGAPRSGAYLTITNKSTSHLLNFDIILDKVADISSHISFYIPRLKSWITLNITKEEEL